MQQIVSGAFPFVIILVCCATEGKTNDEEQRGWMIYRGPSFLSFLLVVLNSHTPPPPTSPLYRQQIVSLSQSSCVSPIQLTDGKGGGGGRRGAEPYDRKKAWSSINCSILSGEKDVDGERDGDGDETGGDVDSWGNENREIKERTE